MRGNYPQVTSLFRVDSQQWQHEYLADLQLTPVLHPLKHYLTSRYKARRGQYFSKRHPSTLAGLCYFSLGFGLVRDAMLHNDQSLDLQLSVNPFQAYLVMQFLHPNLAVESQKPLVAVHRL